jgi:hypothetical protein
MNQIFVRNIISTLFIIFGWLGAMSQNSELSSADSLFNNQKYTEAFEKYENIFNAGIASPAMLTRMAFIQEGLGNYSNALYFLNLYYLQSSDRDALNKMREIAEEHQLSGYEYSDFKFFENFVRKYQKEILLGLMAFSLFLVGYSYRKIKKEERPMISIGVQTLTLLIILAINNQLFVQTKGIIKQDQSLLMSGPSAASEPLELIGQGNKVIILESNELWSKIEWQDEEAYIRNKNIRKL